jgi:hypothetical protein
METERYEVWGLPGLTEVEFPAPCNDPSAATAALYGDQQGYGDVESIHYDGTTPSGGAQYTVRWWGGEVEVFYIRENP